jgi:hypothetical protein
MIAGAVVVVFEHTTRGPVQLFEIEYPIETYPSLEMTTTRLVLNVGWQYTDTFDFLVRGREAEDGHFAKAAPQMRPGGSAVCVEDSSAFVIA